MKGQEEKSGERSRMSSNCKPLLCLTILCYSCAIVVPESIHSLKEAKLEYPSKDIQEYDRIRAKEDWGNEATLHTIEIPKESGTRADQAGLDDELTEEKRKWGRNNMRVWGKRSISDGHEVEDVNGERGDLEENKRGKWATNKLRVWGKRQWGKNNMRVWGKRDGYNEEAEDEGEDIEDARVSEAEKVSISGEQLVQLNRVKGLEREVGSTANGERAGVPQKRYPTVYGGPKRNWKTNMLRVWGKRSQDQPNNEEERAEREVKDNTNKNIDAGW